MSIKKTLLSLILTLTVSVSAAIPVYAVNIASECDISDIDVPIEVSNIKTDIGESLEIKAKSAVLMEVSTGEILYEKEPDLLVPPASITKIMSLLLIMEAIENKQFSLEDVCTASEHAASMGGSQIWLKENESMTVDDLLKAAVIASANDATVALAEKVAGSEEGFVALMNKKAKELGLLKTTFKNATGLDADGHLSSAHDVAVMSRELIKHDLIKRYSTVWMESLRGGETELVNTNKLIRFYEGATGLKTGTTSGAGYCLSATAEREGLSLVAVVMSGDTSADRFSSARKLLDFGFSNYKVKTVAIDKKELGGAKVLGGTEKTVKPQTPEIVPLLLKKSDDDQTKTTVTYKENLKAPLTAGDKIGVLQIKRGEETLYTTDLLAEKDIKKRTVLTVFLSIFKSLFIP